MGAYGSRPIMDLETQAEANDFLRFCSASVQGWRMSQEDAHLNKLVYDPDTQASIFGVFDGHGGSEVAKYTAEKLLDILKQHENTKSGAINFAKAIRETFLKIDAQIGDPKNKSALEEYITDEETTDEEDEAEEVKALCDEADEPIEKIIEKYGGEENVEEETKTLLEQRRKSMAKGKTKEEDKKSENESGDNNKDNEGSDNAKKSTNTEDKETNGDGDNEEEEDDNDDDDKEDDDDSYTSESDDEDENDDIYDAIPMNEESVPGFSSGTTACVCLLVPDKKSQKVRLITANAGDSRAILCRDGKYVDLSLDHKPEDEKELKRITAAGGVVNSEGRVCGGLNLSRAIGDHNYKKREDLSLSDQIITSNPDVSEVELDPKTDKFLVIACDGIWNSMTSQEVIDFINARLDDNSLLRKCRKKLEDLREDDDYSDDSDNSEEDEQEKKSDDKSKDQDNKNDVKADDQDNKDDLKSKDEKNGKSKETNGSKADLEENPEEEKPLPTNQEGIIAEIIEDLFHHVLAENTSPEALGCDNMTCTIVMLNNLKGYAKRAQVELEEISTSLPCQTANTTDVDAKKRKSIQADDKAPEAKKIKTN